MTTQRDLDTAAEVPLDICAKCGWYTGFSHDKHCDPVRGARAQRLIAAVPEVRAGQLGYGEDGVVFDLHDDLTVLFRVAPSGSNGRAFDLRDVTLFGSLNTAEAAALVRAIKTWSDDVIEKRRDATAAAQHAAAIAATLGRSQ